MSVQVRRRREAASFLSSYVGAQGELIVDTTSNRVQIHDGVTPGGWPAARLADVLAGFRNRIVNGAMRIDQRNAGAAQTLTAGAALAYTVDRFYAYATGANVTGQQIAAAGLTRYQFTGASGVTGIGFGQRIEAANSADLAGTTATLGVTLANALPTTVTWAAYYANSTDAFGTLASPTRTQIASGAFTVGASPARYAAQIAVPAAATTGIEIVLSVGAQTSGSWTIGDVQLEPGAIATSFERRPAAAEFVLASYYYQLLLGVTVQVPAAGNMSTPFYFRTMRTVPVQSNVSGPNMSNLSGAAFVPSSVNMGYTQLAATAPSGYANGWTIALNAEL